MKPASKIAREQIKRICRWCWNEFRYRPAGRFHDQIITRSWVFLLLLYLILMSALTVLFATLYGTLGVVWNPAAAGGAGGPVTNYGELVGYSFFWQMVLDGSGLSPRGTARLISGIQGLSAVLLNAILLGIVVTKVLDRNHLVLFADRACYDRKNHRIVIWAWNRDARGLHDLKHSLALERKLNNQEDNIAKVGRYDLKVYYNHVLIEPMRGIMIRSSAEGIEDHADPQALSLYKSDQPCNICSTDEKRQLLWKDSELSVEIRAVEDYSSKVLFFIHRYKMDEITCGEFADYSDSSADWHYREFERFGTIARATLPHECGTCDAHDCCPLQPAVNYRLSIPTVSLKSQKTDPQ